MSLGIATEQGQNFPQVRLAEDQHLIQALAAQCADQTFRITILSRRSRRDWPVANPVAEPHLERQINLSPCLIQIISRCNKSDILFCKERSTLVELI
jgi:hypothetical protein